MTRTRTLGAGLLLAAALSYGCSDDKPTEPRQTGGGSNMPFDSGIRSQIGSSFSWSFPDTGIVPYHCTPHMLQGMVGAVVVGSSGPDSALVSVVDFAFVPDTVAIGRGGTVRWVWQAIGHNVASGPVVVSTRPGANARGGSMAGMSHGRIATAR